MVIGAMIVVTVALDIFRSLLVPRANTRILRVMPVLTAGVFTLWQVGTNKIRSNRTRQTVRARYAPLMLVLTFVVWASLLILGFGCLFWGTRNNFSIGFATFGDAVYSAGAAFSTLGVEGKIAGYATRLIVLVCSISGLAIVTVVATFLIAIQSSFTKREILVLRLESHVTLPPAGIAILETYAREDIVSRLAPFFDAWELWIAELAITHRAYPILLFFRSNDSRCEWLAALGAVLDAAALVDTSIEPVCPEVRASARFLLRSGSRVLADLSRQLTEGVDETREIGDDARYLDDLARLRAAGFDLVADVRIAARGYEERRRDYAFALAALSGRLHISVDERTFGDRDSVPVSS